MLNELESVLRWMSCRAAQVVVRATPQALIAFTQAEVLDRLGRGRYALTVDRRSLGVEVAEVTPDGLPSRGEPFARR